MPRKLNGRLCQDALVTQEDKEALHPATAGRDCRGRQRLLEGSLDPRINIRRRGLGQVLIEGGPTGLGHQHCKTFEGAEGAFLRRWRLVADAQMGEIVRDQALVVGTKKVQPTQLRECVAHWGGL
jgi:hypothetical protein